MLKLHTSVYSYTEIAENHINHIDLGISDELWTSIIF